MTTRLTNQICHENDDEGYRIVVEMPTTTAGTWFAACGDSRLGTGMEQLGDPWDPNWLPIAQQLPQDCALGFRVTSP